MSIVALLRATKHSTKHISMIRRHMVYVQNWPPLQEEQPNTRLEPLLIIPPGIDLGADEGPSSILPNPGLLAGQFPAPVEPRVQDLARALFASHSLPRTETHFLSCTWC